MSKPWTTDELTLLQRDDVTIREMSVKLARSYNSVAIKRRRLGLAPLPLDSHESRKTHCPKGHEYSGDNLHITSQGHRRCIACVRERNRHVRRGCQRCAENVPHEFNHGTSTGYNYHSCRCADCREWFRSTSQRYYWTNREKNLEYKRRQRERNLEVHRERERAKRNKPETKAAIQRRKEKLARVPVSRSREWTPHEKALVLRDDLSVLELAYMLQRSPGTVQAQRNYLQRSAEILEQNRVWRHRHYPACADCGRLMRPGRKHVCGRYCTNGHLRSSHERRAPGGKVYCVICKSEYRKAHPNPRQPERHALCQNCSVEFRIGNSRARFCSQRCGDAYRNHTDFCSQGHLLSDDTDAAGRRICLQCKPSHCGKGHKFTVANTYYRRTDGARICRECRRLGKRERDEKDRQNRPPGTATCRQCGSEFTYSRRGGYPPQYCSDSCRSTWRSGRRQRASDKELGA